MKIDVIDCRGFVKTPPYNMLAGKPINNAQTACSSVSGQGSSNGLKVVAQPISPSIK